MHHKFQILKFNSLVQQHLQHAPLLLIWIVNIYYKFFINMLIAKVYSADTPLFLFLHLTSWIDQKQS